MQLLGIDFTSAPRKAKPITCAIGFIESVTKELPILFLEKIIHWTSFEPFERALNTNGPWIMAVDLPLGQPRLLVEALNWPMKWEAYVEIVGKITKQEFCEIIKQYRDAKPAGKKHLFRKTDKLAGACSPMMLYGVPVGKMFFEGAPRIMQSGVSVMPCRSNGDQRTVIEGYPRLVANSLSKYLGDGFPQNCKYKSESSSTNQERKRRKAFLDRCQKSKGLAEYGIRLEMTKKLADDLVNDPSGDKLDAMFCLVQAAAWHLDFSIVPIDADPLEGWIVDPSLN